MRKVLIGIVTAGMVLSGSATVFAGAYVNSFAGGIAYAYNQKFYVNLGIGYSAYEDDDYVNKKLGTDIKIEYEKDIIFLALGLEYRFM